MTFERLPLSIKMHLKEITDLNVVEYEDFHRSGDKVYNINNKYILKISENIVNIRNEYEKDLWLSNIDKIFIKPIEFKIRNDIAYYLREFLDGDPLCLPKYLENPDFVIDTLVEAMNYLHSIKVPLKNVCLVHGDFCLPNIVVKDDKFIGFVDLGEARIDDPWVDYSWCIWSLEYNLKTKEHTQKLLDKLGISFDETKYKKYVPYK